MRGLKQVSVWSAEIMCLVASGWLFWIGELDMALHAFALAIGLEILDTLYAIRDQR